LFDLTIRNNKQKIAKFLVNLWDFRKSVARIAVSVAEN
jgi:hypothetical protein